MVLDVCHCLRAAKCYSFLAEGPEPAMLPNNVCATLYVYMNLHIIDETVLSVIDAAMIFKCCHFPASWSPANVPRWPQP
jgi:hypothetical protein